MSKIYFEINPNKICILIGLTLVFLFATIAVIDQPVSAAETDSISFNENYPGDRNAGQYFTWQVNNSSGLANVTHHYTVYDWKMLQPDQPDHWYSDSWARWNNQSPEKGNKYLFVWILGYTTGTTTWGYGDNRFFAWIGNRSYSPDPILLADAKRGNTPRYEPVIIGETVNHTTPKDLIYSWGPYGWKDGIELDRIEPGKNSGFNGYLKFQIPNATAPEDIRIAGWFGYWGTATWNIIPQNITQAKPIEKTIEPIPTGEGERLSDNEMDRGRDSV